jgi:hypothetical protein
MARVDIRCAGGGEEGIFAPFEFASGMQVHSNLIVINLWLNYRF